MYSTVDTVTKKINQTTLIQLLNDEGRAEADIDLTDSADAATIRFNQAATDAQTIIDPYLRGRYTLPFTTAPDIIVSLSDDMTIYNLYKRRGDIPDNIQFIKKANDKMLENIMNGKIDIGISTEPQSLKNEINVNKTSSDKIFNDDDVWDKY